MNIVRFYIIIFVQINLVIKKIIFSKDVELTNPFNKLLFVVQDKAKLGGEVFSVSDPLQNSS